MLFRNFGSWLCSYGGSFGWFYLIILFLKTFLRNSSQSPRLWSKHIFMFIKKKKLAKQVFKSLSKTMHTWGVEQERRCPKNKMDQTREICKRRYVLNVSENWKQPILLKWNNGLPCIMRLRISQKGIKLKKKVVDTNICNIFHKKKEGNSSWILWSRYVILWI